jgi:hypothetical protein
MPAEPQSGFDEEFDTAIEGWRNRHKLREDDAVFLLIELFRIHQRHWDELRKRDAPAEQFGAGVVVCAEAAKAIQAETSELLKALQTIKALNSTGVSATTAFVAVLCALTAGFIIGHWFS